MSDDSPDQVTNVVNKDPWAPQQPFLTEGFSRARDDVLNKPIQFFPNSSVVPFSNQTASGLLAAENRATAGSPLLRGAGQHLQDTISGDYLNANPHFDDAVYAATRPLLERFSDTVIPGIQAGFSGKGRYGSGLQAYQQRQAGEDLLRQIGDVSGAMSFKNFQDERGRMVQGTAMAPTQAATDYIDPTELQRVGASHEALAGANLQDQMARFMQQQTAPQDAVSNYMRMIAGGQFGGQTTSQQPVFTNSFGEGLGAAATIAGIGGTLFGRDSGIFPNALSNVKF